jgi:hypothetical protein
MDLRPNTRADKFNYVANSIELEKIHEIAQLKGSLLELDGLSEMEQADAILTLYGFIAYEEGFRKGLNELKELTSKVTIKKRSKNKFIYKTNNQEQIVNLIRKREKSKRMRKGRAEYCLDNKIENHNETFLLSLVINTFFEAGYTDITYDTSEVVSNMYLEDEEKSKEISKMIDSILLALAGIDSKQALQLA